MPGRGYYARTRQKATRRECRTLAARHWRGRFRNARVPIAIHGNKAAKRIIEIKTDGSNRRRRADKRLPQGKSAVRRLKKKRLLFSR